MESERSLIERAMGGVQVMTCAACRGSGETLTDTCPACGGVGAVVINELEVTRVSSDRRFTVLIRDYESGAVPDQLSNTRVENAIMDMLDEDGSDGTVIVEEVAE